MHPEGMPYQHKGVIFTRRFEHRLELTGDPLAISRARSRFAPHDPGSIIAAHPREFSHLALDSIPA